ncbi:uncharacterized protein LOC114759495 [Neltuma alba]|uniref:uncharacterized protein LOC114736353 n=1 Tax=Neltuma alba TaxID=207710 RepID=UPI0010A4D37E|nr:uncharacterized protein LOC114736353 [Prosopis alba]XP_028804506.1 uncharacterized protein LOC114759495 [Prosopis alba]
MAVELCSENCGASTMSPRISFSHDFSQSDVIPVEQTPFRSNSSGLNSSFDFDVCVRESLEQESSSADELFSDGKMIPTEIKKKKKKKDQSPLHQTVPPTETVRENASTRKTIRNESLRELKQQQPVVNTDEVDEKQSSNSNNTNKSFWGFKRSSSCGSGGYGRSLCPLPLLSRSNSTGSAPTPSAKRMPLSKEGPNMKQNPHKHTPTRPYQKPPLKKIHGSYVHNGVRVNPVINVPSANLFGLGSIFSSNKDKSKKK